MQHSLADLEGLHKWFEMDFVWEVADRLELSRPDAMGYVEQLTFYLAIVAEAQHRDPAARFTPPHILDQVWHIWLEPKWMESYRNFCLKYFGRMVEQNVLPPHARSRIFYDIARELGLTLKNHKGLWAAGNDSDCG